MAHADPAPLELLPLGGIRFRPILGAQDAVGLAAVHAARAAADGLDPLDNKDTWPSVDDLRRSLALAITRGGQERWLVVEHNGAVAGYCQIEDWREDDGTWVYLHEGWVIPALRGQGIGSAMLAWCENRIRALAARDHPGERWEFAANASSTEASATALLRHAGYTAPYHVLSLGLRWEAVPPLTPLPAGVETRPVLPEHLRPLADAIHQDYLAEPAVEGAPPDRYCVSDDPAEYALELAGPGHDPTLWQVAWHDDRIVGQVLVQLQGAVAEVIEVSVHPAWRRQGIARALLLRALAGLRARGQEVVRIHTVREYRTRAVDLYRSVGFEMQKTFPRYRKVGN